MATHSCLEHPRDRGAWWAASTELDMTEVTQQQQQQQARILEWVTISFSRDLPDPRVNARSPALMEVSCIAGGIFTN